MSSLLIQKALTLEDGSTDNPNFTVFIKTILFYSYLKSTFPALVELFSKLWLFLKNMSSSGDIQRYLRDVTVSHTNLQTKPLKPSCIWAYISITDSMPEFMGLYPNKGGKKLILWCNFMRRLLVNFLYIHKANIVFVLTS